MPARDVIHAQTSSCNDSETDLTNPIEYMYPHKWLRSLFMTKGAIQLIAKSIMHFDTRIVSCDTYSFFLSKIPAPKRESLLKA